MVRALVLTVALTLTVGVAARAADSPIPADFRKALEKAEKLELYSLDPGMKPAKDDVTFHDYKVLGKTAVKKESLKKLVTAFKKGVEEADQRVAAGCFRPRHGIRVSRANKTYDFLICFECVQVALYGGDAKKNAGFHVSHAPAEVFNKVLKDAKVKLPEQPEKE